MSNSEFIIDEIWKPVEGFGGCFEVSNTGKVRRVKGIRKHRIMKEIAPRISPCGYYRVCLRYGGIISSTFVHRLVARAFIPNPRNVPFVNHIDGNKSNNHASNLEWVTAKENTAHAIKTGLIKPGDENGNVVIHKSLLPELYGLRRIGLSYAEISEILGINPKTIATRYFKKDYKRYYSEQEFEKLVSEYVDQNKDKYKRRDGRKLVDGGKRVKGVIQIDKNGEVIGKYDSIKEAAAANGISGSAVSCNVRGKTHYCNGYKYVYE